MADKHRKTHPWRVMLKRDVVSVMRFSDGSETPFPQSAGERMCRRKSEAEAFAEAMRAEHGADVVSDVYRAA